MTRDTFQRKPGDGFPEICVTEPFVEDGSAVIVVSGGVPDFAKAPTGFEKFGIQKDDRLDVVAVHSLKPLRQCPQCKQVGIEKVWRLRAANGRMATCFECVNPKHQEFVWARTQADEEEEKVVGASA